MLPWISHITDCVEAFGPTPAAAFRCDVSLEADNGCGIPNRNRLLVKRGSVRIRIMPPIVSAEVAARLPGHRCGWLGPPKQCRRYEQVGPLR